MPREAPSHFSLRAVAVCSLLAVLLLLLGGGTLGDAARLLAGVLAIGPDQEGLVRLLLGRTVTTFTLVTLALIMGLSIALASVVLVAHFGGVASRIAGWLGRAISCVPPMAWALGLVLLLIQGLELPIETLFPYVPREEIDSWSLQLGRKLWAWLVPAMALALPVAGAALYTLTHRLSALLKSPLIEPLRARGLSRRRIVYHHLLPEMQSEAVGVARPVAALTLALAIPVEEVFRFDGWGRYMATAVREHQPASMAAAIYLAGFMLAGWYALLGIRGSLPVKKSSYLIPPEQTRCQICAFLGFLLALLLVTLPTWVKLNPAWHLAYAAAAPELGRALFVSFVAAFLIYLSGPLMMLRHGWRESGNSGIATTLAAAPLLVCWLALASIFQKPSATLLGLIMAATLPGAAAFRRSLLSHCESGHLIAAHTMGEKPLQVWWRHLSLVTLLEVLGQMFRNVATVLLWYSLFTYLSLPETGTEPLAWGAQMSLKAASVLDDPQGVLAPAMMLALWSLSFRLVSRAFSPEPLQQRITSPVPR
jgi:ABC-type dipeptide/oligopeptide/nickel transport system permease component